MKIKKIIAGLLVATTAFSLAACGNSGSGDTKKSDADTSEKKEIVVSVDCPSMENPRDHIQNFSKMQLFQFLRKKDIH
jgi:predicted small lipoprotein YifL